MHRAGCHPEMRELVVPAVTTRGLEAAIRHADCKGDRVGVRLRIGPNLPGRALIARSFGHCRIQDSSTNREFYREEDCVYHCRKGSYMIASASILEAQTRQQPGLRNQNAPSVAHRMQRLERVAHLLDSAFAIPGTRYRVGWDSVIGLIPGVGDFATTLVSAWIIHQAYRLGASKVTLARMVWNSGLDMLLGTVPLAGDLFDATFKSNQKNLALLRRHLARKGLHPGHSSAVQGSLGMSASP